jgi:hypothetical protein
LNKEFGPFGDDPCPLGGKLCMDGRAIDWSERTFVNPPYNEIPKWIKKALEEKEKGKTVVMLIPARVKSKYWFDYIWTQATEIRFYRKVKFPGYNEPIACVVFKPVTIWQDYIPITKLENESGRKKGKQLFILEDSSADIPVN